MNVDRSIDISENTLRNRGRVLEVLLLDRTRYKPSQPHNIIWATDSYIGHGKDYSPTKQIKREQITGVNGSVIQPRAAKSREEQKYRTKDKAEVFTPLKIVKEMNMAINWAGGNWPATESSWQDYIKERRLEIACGEAPFIAGRYDPANEKAVVTDTKKRVGFLDYKLRTVSEFVDNKKDWLKYAEIALKASYGYEWQGDNLLIARENILQTMDDFYTDFCANKLKFKTVHKLSDEQLEQFAEIISWNIWQMDGLKYIIPMSCKKKITKREVVSRNQLSFPLRLKTKKQIIECEGCRTGNPQKHTGRKVRIMDWESGKTARFVDLAGD